MRMDISKPKFAILMIRCAAVLHNLLLNDNAIATSDLLDCDATEDADFQELEDGANEFQPDMRRIQMVDFMQSNFM